MVGHQGMWVEMGCGCWEEWRVSEGHHVLVVQTVKLGRGRNCQSLRFLSRSDPRWVWISQIKICIQLFCPLPQTSWAAVSGARERLKGAFKARCCG